MTWPSIITDIQAAGYTQGQIASFAGCAQSSINDLLTGKTRDPRHSIGESLMRLHRKSRKSRPELTKEAADA